MGTGRASFRNTRIFSVSMRICGTARIGVGAWMVWALLLGIAMADDPGSKDAASKDPPATEPATTEPAAGQRRKYPPVPIAADPLTIEPGKPLSLRALVTEPMQLEG